MGLDRMNRRILVSGSAVMAAMSQKITRNVLIWKYQRVANSSAPRRLCR